MSDGKGGFSTATATITIDGVSLPSIEPTATAEVTTTLNSQVSSWFNYHWSHWAKSFWKGGWGQKHWDHDDDQQDTSYDVTFTYEVHNTSEGPSDESLTLTSLMTDMGTPDDPSDDVDVLDLTDYLLSGNDDNDPLDVGETWKIVITDKFDFDEADSLVVSATVYATDNVDGVDDEPNIADSTVKTTLEKPLPVVTHEARFFKQNMKGNNEVKDIFEVNANHRGVDKIYNFSLDNGDELEFEGWRLNQASIEDGSLGLRAHRNDNLSIWANKDFDERLEKVAVLKDFFEDNELFNFDKYLTSIPPPHPLNMANAQLATD